MKTFIKLYSNENGEIIRFLKKLYKKEEFDKLSDSSSNTFLLEWEKDFENPVEMADIIGVFIDNIDDFKINMWICLDKDILINVTKNNANDLIKYLYERFPY